MTRTGYRVCFSNPRAPSFFWPDPPYSYEWALEWAAGIASAVQKDFEIPCDESSDARKRGEHMGQKLKLYARRWNFAESDFRAIAIEWHTENGVIRKAKYATILELTR